MGGNILYHQASNAVFLLPVAGADPGFQVRGGALKKIAPSRGRRENCWGISCEKSRFYAKKHIFSIVEGGTKIVEVFRVKNHDFTPKKITFFTILGGARAGCVPPPESAPVEGNDFASVSTIFLFDF